MQNLVVSPQDATRRAMLEEVVWAWYDTNLVGTAQSATLTYFTVPQGQSSKSARETNLVQGGSLNDPNVFKIETFSTLLIPRAAQALTDVTDQGVVLWSLIFAFYMGIEGKKYANHPVGFFPAGRGHYGMVTTGGATTSNVAHVLTNGVPTLNNRWNLGKFGLTLSPNEAFRGEITSPSGAITISNSVSCMVILDGVLGQAVR